jgi:DNA-binding NarL/FixJ family response regulator
MDTLKIIIADNQMLTRIGIKTALSGYFKHLISIDEASSKEELLQKLASIQYNLLILDYQLFCLNIPCELSEVKKLSPDSGILIVTANHSPSDILSVIDCGITNYILKTSDTKELFEAFNATLTNRKYFSGEILDILLEYKSTIRQVHENRKLTFTEIEIIKQIGRGLTTKEIAALKGLSYHTIMTHRKNIFRKLNIGNASELIIYAMKEGWIDTMEYCI